MEAREAGLDCVAPLFTMTRRSRAVLVVLADDWVSRREHHPLVRRDVYAREAPACRACSTGISACWTWYAARLDAQVELDGMVNGGEGLAARRWAEPERCSRIERGIGRVVRGMAGPCAAGWWLSTAAVSAA